MKYLSGLTYKNLSNETCLLRVDLNVQDADLRGLATRLPAGRQGLTRNPPLRIKAILPTIKFLINRGAKIVILSHRGRPPKVQSSKFKVQSYTLSYTLKPFAKILSKLLKKPVHFITLKEFAFIDKTKKRIQNSGEGTIFLAENLRFLPGEEKNNKRFAKKLASLGGFYINDAFAVCHRTNASVETITRFLPSCAGLLLEKEIKNLNKVMKKPEKPLIFILGGAKISDKIGLIKSFLKKADYFLIGGGIANTFFAAKNFSIGDSLYEKKMIPAARQLLKSPKIILPIDLTIKKEKILDIGSKTIEKYGEFIKKARTIVWNGPMGYIEKPLFAKGSKAIAQSIIKSRAFSVIGGGETTSLVSSVKRQVSSKTFVSTGGGAMLKYLAGKKLPGIEALK